MKPSLAVGRWVEEAYSFPYGAASLRMRLSPCNGGSVCCWRYSNRASAPYSIRKLGCMDSMEINKGMAAILVAGIMFFLTGLIGMHLVTETRLEKPAIAIQGAPVAEAASGAAKPEVLPPIGPLLAKADVATGEATVKKLCTSCHTVAEGGKAGVGPNLYGVVGGAHGHMDGFNYSAGMKAKTGSWTFAELNEWLHKPASFVAGTRMAFAGINNDQQRADVIAYLRSLSHTPVPLSAN